MSICSSQRILNSDGISGELVSAKVGGNFTAAAVLRRRISDLLWPGASSIGRDLLFPRGTSLLVYLHYRRICPRSQATAGRMRRDSLASAKRVSVHPVHARINIWIFMKRLSERAQPAGLSIRLSESCFETRLISDGRSVSSSNTIDVDVDVSVGVGFGVSLRRVQRFSIYSRHRCLL